MTHMTFGRRAGEHLNRLLPVPGKAAAIEQRAQAAQSTGSDVPLASVHQSTAAVQDLDKAIAAGY